MFFWAWGERTCGFPPGSPAWMDQCLSLKHRWGASLGCLGEHSCSQQAQRRQFSRQETQMVWPPAAEEAPCQEALDNQHCLYQTPGGKEAPSPVSCPSKVALLCHTPAHFCLSAVLPPGPHTQQHLAWSPIFGSTILLWGCSSVSAPPRPFLGASMDSLCLMLLVMSMLSSSLIFPNWLCPSVDCCLD